MNVATGAQLELTVVRKREKKSPKVPEITEQQPVMFADPSSVTDSTMDVGVASPGATHFFLVR